MKEEGVIETHTHRQEKKQAFYLTQEKFRVYRNFKNENRKRTIFLSLHM